MSILFVFIPVLVAKRVHASNVISVSGKFVFQRVIRKEIYHCVHCCSFAVCVSLYIGVFPGDEKVQIIYTSITFECGVKLYVCMYFVYVFIDVISAYLFCVKYD